MVRRAYQSNILPSKSARELLAPDAGPCSSACLTAAWHAASAFRASLQDISSQEAGLHKDISALSDSLHSSPSMQVLAAICLHVCSTSGFCSSSGCSGSTQQPLKGTWCLQSLLTQCLSAYNSNQARLATMEKHLEQYGYSQQYSHPAPEDPFSQLSQPAPAGLPASSAQQVPSVACIQASAIG